MCVAALAWFKDQFIKCNDRAALVKTWLPIQYDGPKTYLDQLIYDRALLLVSFSWGIISSLFLSFSSHVVSTHLVSSLVESNRCTEGIVRRSDLT